MAIVTVKCLVGRHQPAQSENQGSNLEALATVEERLAYGAGALEGQALLEAERSE